MLAIGFQKVSWNKKNRFGEKIKYIIYQIKLNAIFLIKYAIEGNWLAPESTTNLRLNSLLSDYNFNILI